MDIIKAFKRNVVENKSVIFISFIVVFLIRLYIFYASDDTGTYPFLEGFLWTDFISRLFENSFVSFIAGFIFTICITLYCSYINTKYKLIRDRSFLIYIFLPLLLSIHPSFIYMHPQWISCFFVLLSFDALFSSYQYTNASGDAYRIGFFIGLGSLFSFSTIIYIPLFWFGFSYMRTLNLRTCISSILGLVTVLWLILFYFLWKRSFDEFILPFEQLYPIFHNPFSLLHSSGIAVIAISVLLLIILFVNYASNSHHDKVQTRAYLSYLFIMTAFSFTACIFIRYDLFLNAYISIICGSFLLSHFFSLADQKWKVYLFYIFVSLYFAATIYFING